MRKSQILWGFFAVVGLVSAVMATTGHLQFLWVFPLDSGALPLWMAICAVDVLLALAGRPERTMKARLFLWCGGLLYFTARQGVPGLGISLIAGAAMLWVGARSSRLLPVVAGVAVVLFLFGHDAQLLHGGMAARLKDLRFSLQLLSAFALFRMLSWTLAVVARRERPGFFTTMEYFLAPAFWLSPLHAAHLVFDHMQARAKPVPAERSVGWIARGFLHAMVFSILVSAAVPWLQAHYQAGISSFRWWECLALGPLLFVVAYFEKSRVSYIVAGLLSLSGRDITPDFRAPWLARSLPDYWRRFHFWVWEYYMDFIYIPLSVRLLGRFSPRAAGLIAMFLTFSVGTSLIHWVHYPAPFSMALLLGCLFGGLTLLHSLAGRHLQSSKLGIPVTWLSVFFLYAAAYPVYGLGWGVPEFLEFLRR